MNTKNLRKGVKLSKNQLAKIDQPAIGINKCIDDDIVDRDELYICSKLWCTDVDPKDVEDACRESLKKSNLDYFDNVST